MSVRSGSPSPKALNAIRKMAQGREDVTSIYAALYLASYEDRGIRLTADQIDHILNDDAVITAIEESLPDDVFMEDAEA